MPKKKKSRLTCRKGIDAKGRNTKRNKHFPDVRIVNMDIIETLLQSTGLSCEDLLNQLQKYKSFQECKDKKEGESSSNVGEIQSSTSSKQVTIQDNSVILNSKVDVFCDNIDDKKDNNNEKVNISGPNLKTLQIIDVKKIVEKYNSDQDILSTHEKIGLSEEFTSREIIVEKRVEEASHKTDTDELNNVEDKKDRIGKNIDSFEKTEDIIETSLLMEEILNNNVMPSNVGIADNIESEAKEENELIYNSKNTESGLKKIIDEGGEHSSVNKILNAEKLSKSCINDGTVYKKKDEETIVNDTNEGNESPTEENRDDDKNLIPEMEESVIISQKTSNSGDNGGNLGTSTKNTESKSNLFLKPRNIDIFQKEQGELLNKTPIFEESSKDDSILNIEEQVNDIDCGEKHEIEKNICFDEEMNNIKENNTCNENTADVNCVLSVGDHDYSHPILASSDSSKPYLTKNDMTSDPEVSGRDDNDNEDVEKSNEEPPVSGDSLRDIIRMQLSSLRNMKKSSGYLSDVQKKKSILFQNIKKKRKSFEVNPKPGDYKTTESEQNKINKGQESKIKSQSNEKSLVSTSDEIDLKIASVCGGVDLLSEIDGQKSKLEEPEDGSFAFATDSSDQDKPNLDSDSNLDVSTQSVEESPTKEIRNIISNFRRKIPLKLNRYNSSPTEDSESLIVRRISENFSKDSDIDFDESMKHTEKSPFVSNSLDDFLNESSQLKVSYAIPKLGAEEGISDKSKLSPYESVESSKLLQLKYEVKADHDQSFKSKPKLKKAKTLADMRRQFEKLHSKRKIETEKINSKDNSEVRSFNKKVKERKKSVFVEKPTTKTPSTIDIKRSLQRNSYVTYNKKRIWVYSYTNLKNKCVAVIDGIIKCPTQEKKTFSAIDNNVKKVVGANKVVKPSIFMNVSTPRKSTRVKYKPGPLCKKVNLQNVESRNNWTTEVKKLPTIHLEVIPELNKPIDPKIVHLIPIFDDAVITEERSNFALTALKTKNEIEPKAYNFYIPFHNNQEKMIVRKPNKSATHKDCWNDDKDPKKIIGSVLGDIITYVETKEIENTLIKDDDTVFPLEEKIVSDESPKKRNRTKIKRKRIDLELRRLNCQVIDVATEGTEDVECTRSYCKLGCICKSLLCQSIFSNHCQLVECMFGCNCLPLPVSESVKAKDSLPSHTVNHIDDKAKRNLAKVEREFTQTLIHTNGDVILVGRDKMKRECKVPKRYNDFIGDIDEASRNVVPVVPEKELLAIIPCSVPLEKLELDNIKPYCLSHDNYNCYCKGQIVDIKPKYKSFHEISKVDDAPFKIKITRRKEEQPKTNEELEVKEKETKIIEETCARLRPVHSEYMIRNKHPAYTRKLLRYTSASYASSLNRQETFQLLNSNLNDGEIIVDNKESKKCNKRKQSFTIREDILLRPAFSSRPLSRDNLIFEKEFAIQRRKKKEKVRSYYPVFDGEIKLSLSENQKLLADSKYGPLDYLRILPWTKLIESFQNRKINIWSRDKVSSELMCNAAGYFPPKDFIDIRKVFHRSEIIGWILTDSLPADRPRELMHLIITPRNNHFLISGHCLKNFATGSLSIEASNNQGQKNKFSDFSGNYGLNTTIERVSPTGKQLSIEPLSTVSSIKALVNSNKNWPFSSVVIQAQSEPEQLVQNSTSSETKTTISSHKSISQIPKRWTSSAYKVSAERSKHHKPADAIIVQPEMALPYECGIQIEPVERSRLEENEHEPLEINTLEENERHSSCSNSSLAEVISLDEDQQEDIVIAQSGPELTTNLREAFSDHTQLIFSAVATPEKNTKEKDHLRESRSPVRPPSVFKRKLPLPTSEIPPNKILKKVLFPAHKTIPSRSIKCTHKDLNNKNCTLVLTNKQFEKRTLFVDDASSDKEIVLSLPKISRKFKWRMIYLKSDFSYLMFVRSQYSIKYTDLMDVVKMSRNVQSTITLRNKAFSCDYKHPYFGIFCVPDYDDRLFIGPYGSNEQHSIDTMRYLRGKLISTDSFDKITGKKSNPPTWIHEVPVQPQVVMDIDAIDVIDITEDDEDVSVVDDTVKIVEGVSPTHKEVEEMSESLLCPPFVEELTTEELKLNKVNRYIITNIPHLGYFEAYQRENKAIEVYWPKRIKGCRFPNVTFAKHALILYLSQIFCPIPYDYKINVIIMTNLDTRSNKPVDWIYFSNPGSHICGEFGIYARNLIPEDLLEHYQVATVDELLKTNERAEENVNQMIRLFGLFLMSNDELRKHPEPLDVLQWATSEIYIMKKLLDNYESEKADLRNLIAQRQGAEASASTPTTPAKVSEPIEITDSDEEDITIKEPPKNQQTFKKISKSGKIVTGNFIYTSNEVRSLLKPRFLQTTRSLLKISDKIFQNPAVSSGKP